MAARAMEIPSMARLAALFLHSGPPHAAVRIHPQVSVSSWLQIHHFRVAEVAAIGNIHLIVTSDALRHRREIRSAGQVRCVDAFVTRQTGDRRDMLVMREMGQRHFTRLLNRRRGFVTLDAHFRLRQIVVFDARAFRH